MKNSPRIRVGSAIAYGLVIMAVVSIILTSVLEFVVSNMRYNSYIEAKERAFHIAESGIYFYRWYLSHQIAGLGQEEIDALWSADPPVLLGVGGTYTKDYLDNNGDKLGEVDIDISFPNPGTYNVVEINANGHTIGQPGASRSIRSTLRRSIWSDFAVISDGPVCFDQYWTINGKIMGNNGVHFNGTANNLVSSGVSSYNDTNPLHDTHNGVAGVWEDNPTKSEGEIFRAGYRYPVAKKDFTGIIAHLQAMRNRSRSGGANNGCDATGKGCFFDGTAEGRRIILKSNGTFDMCTVDEYWTNSGENHHYPKKYRKTSGIGTCNDCSGLCLATYNIPNNGGIIYVDDNIWLEGTVQNKRVTIAAASIPDPSDNANIFIVDSIRYTNYDGTDVLGIVAEGDVEILKNVPNNLRIDGAVLAQKGAVTKPEYNPECCGGGCVNNKNYFDVFGNVVTKNGLLFSLHKETCPGLITERTITYDNNLYLNPPPLFPADAFYYVDFWKEL